MKLIGHILEVVGAVCMVACLVLAVMCLLSLNVIGFLWCGVGVVAFGGLGAIGGEMHL